jgi:hypothetical protein
MGSGVVQLRRDGTGFLVEFIPPEPAFPSQTFIEHKAARGFAGGARMVLGRKLLDLTGEG